MAYSPFNVPTDPAKLPDYLRVELQRIAQELSSAQPLYRLAPTTAAPDKPRTGDIRLADGTLWNPISEGFAPLWWDGDSWVPFSLKYDWSFFVGGKPSASELVAEYPAARTLMLPAAMAGSVGRARTAATAQTDFDVQKNGSSVGTIRFAASATSATFIAASAITLAVGDRLGVVAPSSVDATLADISVTLKGYRT